MKRVWTTLYSWIDERVKLGGLVEFMGKKYVPLHRGSVWYYFGGVSLFLFIIQVVTGILLLLYYKGSEQLAFESIQFLMSKVQFGWLMRSVHSWSANLFVLSAVIHMFSVFFERAYRSPREITWLTGMLMLFLALGFGFSGYLLPWNELAFFATKSRYGHRRRPAHCGQATHGVPPRRRRRDGRDALTLLRRAEARRHWWRSVSR